MISATYCKKRAHCKQEYTVWPKGQGNRNNKNNNDQARLGPPTRNQTLQFDQTKPYAANITDTAATSTTLVDLSS